LGEQPAILILGDECSLLTSLAERIRNLGFRSLRAKTPDHAVDFACERGYRFAVGLLGPGTGSLDLDASLAALRARTRSPSLSFIAVGDRPEDEEIGRLRQAGVRTALWHPIGEHALLFQLNAALGDGDQALLREDERAPTDWISRYHIGGRPKQGKIYSLSGGGAFIATPRPSVRGAQLALELPLPEGPLDLLGQVVYTNVPGNLHRDLLPDGMGVRFVDAPSEHRTAIRHIVSQTLAAYEL
jgi:DNA-binding response OmpR family regulator